jgi:hypothetical protein
VPIDQAVGVCLDGATCVLCKNHNARTGLQSACCQLAEGASTTEPSLFFEVIGRVKRWTWSMPTPTMVWPSTTAKLPALVGIDLQGQHHITSCVFSVMTSQSGGFSAQRLSQGFLPGVCQLPGCHMTAAGADQDEAGALHKRVRCCPHKRPANACRLAALQRILVHCRCKRFTKK